MELFIDINAEKASGGTDTGQVQTSFPIKGLTLECAAYDATSGSIVINNTKDSMKQTLPVCSFRWQLVPAANTEGDSVRDGLIKGYMKIPLYLNTNRMYRLYDVYINISSCVALSGDAEVICLQRGIALIAQK